MIYQGVENCQDMAAVFDYALEDGAEFGLAGGFAIPFGEDFDWDSDVAAELLGGMAAQEEAVEEGGFALGEFVVPERLWRSGRQRVGLSRHSKKNAVYGFLALRQEYECQS